MQMKAALFRDPSQPLTIEDVDIAAPGEQEVRVKISAAGVCHSDFRVLAGEWSATPPVVLGHEGAGVIESIGSGVTNLAPGDHVALSWTPSCGTCRYCVSGRPQLCQVAVSTAYRNVLPDGGTRIRSAAGEDVYSYLSVGSFAEYAVVPAYGAIKITGDVDPGIAALVGCAVTTGVGAAINTHPAKPSDSVLVIGAGGVGLSVVMGARLQSPGNLIVVDLAEDKLTLAEELGATHTVNAREHDVLEAVLGITNGRGVDVAYEATGRAQAVEQAYECLTPGGTAVVVGQVASGERISIDPMRMSGRELTLTGSNYGSARPSIDFQRILDMYARQLLPLDRLIGDRVALTDVNEAFARMGAGTTSGRIVVDIP
ncbi:alcohol dehydrogenase catalytic domain-containing protein [Mycolicibacterium confluentis]|uniref:Alcohol dehydrogenase n=1 Tax=Mycolicibacterium confluentis TaxID=28047 RepID=A0A7I7Y6P2_9MYCO|nr:Zn-dependent alcohol dehydrogenase [Mycolicibacterium confluentis]MCV7319149.1 Zn-dependent alcohol dehydrogenase [Mycolicibacterium confluentis]ORV24870.1 dehydrogenase [Mycolicibacterium confluentis]BBZ36763.1 alcohol dehydrogenase [Mycolicibacterium confluentis]